MPRSFFVGGNWKSNGVIDSIKDLATKLKAEKIDNRVEVVVAPTELQIGTVKDVIGSQIQIAVQNPSASGFGAFTGETSAAAIKDFGINYVIIGHSERRALFNETNEVVALKVQSCLSAGLKVIACVGETLEDRNTNKTFDVIKSQVATILEAVNASSKNYNDVVIAYEPVWSIGTGVTASPEQAEEVHAFIRELISKTASAAVSESVRIIYGGSVKPGNSGDLIKKANIDGFLVGGASLDAKSFAAICNSPVAAGQL